MEGGEFDPKTVDVKTTGASGGNDGIPTLPELPADSSKPDRKFRWSGGARPKGPYKYERIPMSELPPEEGGLPPTKSGQKTTETSFIEGLPSGRVLKPHSLKIQTVHVTLEQEYQNYGKDGKLLTPEVKNGKVVVIGPKGGLTNLFKADERTINPNVLKIKANRDTLMPKSTELIKQKDEKIEELDKTIQEDQGVANVENEQPSVRERARERVTENTQQRDQLVQEREKSLWRSYLFGSG